MEFKFQLACRVRFDFGLGRLISGETHGEARSGEPPAPKLGHVWERSCDGYFDFYSHRPLLSLSRSTPRFLPDVGRGALRSTLSLDRSPHNPHTPRERVLDAQNPEHPDRTHARGPMSAYQLRLPSALLLPMLKLAHTRLFDSRAGGVGRAVCEQKDTTVERRSACTPAPPWSILISTCTPTSGECANLN